MGAANSSLGSSTRVSLEELPNLEDTMFKAKVNHTTKDFRNKKSDFRINSESIDVPSSPPSTGRPKLSTSTSSGHLLEKNGESGLDETETKKMLVEILQDLTLFCELSEEQAILIYKSLNKVRTKANQVVYSKGDDASRIFIVYSGSFGTSKDGVVTPLQKRYFGESALMFPNPRAETIVSLTDGVLWTIDRLSYQRQCVKGQQNDSNKNDDFLSNVPVLAPLPKNIRARIASALVRTSFKPNEIIIRQGAEGDSFYIIESGEVVVKEHAGRFRIGEMTDDAVEVVRRYKGDYFGEVALMRDEPRNADVIAVTETVCLKLGREDFLELMTHPLNELLEYNNAHRVLRSMDLLKPLSDDKLTEVAECLQEYSYEEGQHVCKQGDPGTHFYIIKSGQVRCTRIEEGQTEELEIGDLFAGDYFGEGALLTLNPRRANVIAVGEVKLLALGRDEFNAVLGSLRGVMDKTFSAREKASTSKDIPFNELEKIRTIGSGSYGTVDLVRHTVTGATYALKRIRKAMVIKANHQTFVSNERDILKAANHPFLVNLICTYNDKTCVYMLTEVCLGGELYTLMKDTVEGAPYDETAEVPGCFPIETCKFYLANIVCALGYLHGLGIVHRDVKPENLLITNHGYLKLADFGFAKDLKGNRSYSLCGTPEYTAPEVYKRAGHGTPVDWWAVGVLLYEMASGFSPFHVESENSWDCYLEISRYSKSYPNLQFPQIFPKNLCYLLIKFLHPNPYHRIGSGRNGLQEIKNHEFFEGIIWEDLEGMKLKPPYTPPISNIMDTSHFEKYESDPHSDDAILMSEDPTGGAWVEGSCFCLGCDKKMDKAEEETGIPFTCPLCRTPPASSIEENFQRALKRAGEGRVWAQEIVADFYWEGHGVARDYEKAFYYFNLAASQGDANSQSWIGRMYSEGKGVQQSYDLAFKYTKMAADQLLAGAQNNLGLCYASGEGCVLNLETAFSYYMLAADQGYANAMYNIGWCYENGEGVKKDYKNAFKYYTMAAEKDLKPSQFNLAICYKEGKGTPVDHAKAIEWFTECLEDNDNESMVERANEYLRNYYWFYCICGLFFIISIILSFTIYSTFNELWHNSTAAWKSLTLTLPQ